LAQIRHIESFEQHDTEMLCIVTEFAERGDLSAHVTLRKGALIREEVVLDWFVQVCLALLYMHKRKVRRGGARSIEACDRTVTNSDCLQILHRDLKLANVFLAADNQIRLGDFGIARALKYTAECAKTVRSSDIGSSTPRVSHHLVSTMHVVYLTPLAQVVGTPYYFSPEM